MADDQANDKFDEAEAARRFDKALRGALSTPPKPLKDIPKQAEKPKRKRKPVKASS